MKIFLIATLFLAGCYPPINNERIIKETKICEDAGMSSKHLQNQYGETRMVICTPKQ